MRLILWTPLATEGVDDIAPSNELRKCCGHPDRNAEFARRYRAELAIKSALPGSLAFASWPVTDGSPCYPRRSEATLRRWFSARSD